MLLEPQFQVKNSKRRTSNEFSIAVERLRANKMMILERWSKRARQALPAAKDKSKFALFDHLPGYLDEIAEVLEKSKRGTEACGE